MSNEGFRIWLSAALETTVVRRASKYAVVVGAILIAINHGDAILQGDLPPSRLLKMGMTVAVPYLVSTLSSVGTMRDLLRHRTSGHRSGEG